MTPHSLTICSCVWCRQIAIETCPVDCIHWVSAPQLQLLEVALSSMNRIPAFVMQRSGGKVTGARVQRLWCVLRRWEVPWIDSGCDDDWYLTVYEVPFSSGMLPSLQPSVYCMFVMQCVFFVPECTNRANIISCKQPADACAAGDVFWEAFKAFQRRQYEIERLSNEAAGMAAAAAAAGVNGSATTGPAWGFDRGGAGDGDPGAAQSASGRKIAGLAATAARAARLWRQCAANRKAAGLLED